MFHRFDKIIEESELPEQFTYPYCYEPHKLCVIAANEVIAYLDTREDWREEIAGGKMFGVMIVKSDVGEIGYIAAFSGNIAHSNNHDFFVPPVFDLLDSSGFFVKGEDAITHINREIDSLARDEKYLQYKVGYNRVLDERDRALAAMKKTYEKDKQERDTLRIAGDADCAALDRASQFQKAEIKRLKNHYKILIADVENCIHQHEVKINALKEKRKVDSAALQMQIFRHFILLNGVGEKRDLIEIFKETPQKFPPAGAGECAAPKMLQYSYINNYRPIAMAEFWQGASPIKEIRRHGNFYPACIGKCKPILDFMLQGIDVERNPLESTQMADKLEILYEDNYIIAVNKPSGELSVPGKSCKESTLERIKKLSKKDSELCAVHRLDMDTSGILLFAKDKNTHKVLQLGFKNRTIKKRYIAIVDGVINTDEGEINLPIRSDYIERPRQIVCHESGKQALTHYRVINRSHDTTLIEFSPITGRTHQLRVHSAHKNGLSSPIVGDRLYGLHQGQRLHLHASEVTFNHPVSGEIVTIRSKAPFTL